MKTVIKNICLIFSLCIIPLSLHSSDWDKTKALLEKQTAKKIKTLAKQKTQRIAVIHEREGVEVLFGLARSPSKEPLPHLLESKQVNPLEIEQLLSKKAIQKSSITTKDIVTFQEMHPGFDDNFATVILHSSEPCHLKQKVKEEITSLCPIRPLDIDRFQEICGIERNNATVRLHSASGRLHSAKKFLVL